MFTKFSKFPACTSPCAVIHFVGVSPPSLDAPFPSGVDPSFSEDKTFPPFFLYFLVDPGAPYEQLLFEPFSQEPSFSHRRLRFSYFSSFVLRRSLQEKSDAFLREFPALRFSFSFCRVFTLPSLNVGPVYRQEISFSPLFVFPGSDPYKVFTNSFACPLFTCPFPLILIAWYAQADLPAFRTQFGPLSP